MFVQKFFQSIDFIVFFLQLLVLRNLVLKFHIPVFLSVDEVDHLSDFILVWVRLKAHLAELLLLVLHLLLAFIEQAIVLDLLTASLPLTDNALTWDLTVD